MKITEKFGNGRNEIHAIVLDFDGTKILAKRGRKGEIRLETWGDDKDASWNLLKRLEQLGRAGYVYEGLSIAHDDRWEWRGEPIPDLS